MTDATEDTKCIKYEGTYFIIQAYLAVNPNRPQWSDILKTAIAGWSEFEKTPNRVSGYRFGRFWSDVLVWDHQEEAKAAFRILNGRPQEYKLRLIQVWVSHREQEVKP